jgi:hypothetical protein
MFFESDHIHQRTLDARLISLARDAKALQEAAAEALPNASAPFFMGSATFGDRLYRAFGVPWRKDDIHQRLKTM